MKIVIEEGVGWGVSVGGRGFKVLRLTLKAELGGERRYDCGEFSKKKTERRLIREVTR